MKSPHFACLLVVLMSTMVLAQSNPVPSVNQPLMHNGSSFIHQKVKGTNKPVAPQHRGEGAVFEDPSVYGSGGYAPNAIAVGDVNGDGTPDLVVANSCSDYNCSGDGLVGVLLGNGDGTFQPAVTYDSGLHNPAVALALSDVNLDGKLDVIVVQDSGYGADVGVLLGNGDGTFQPATSYNSGGYFTTSVAVADVNGDGFPDLLVAIAPPYVNGLIGVLFGNGDGTFQTAQMHDVGSYGPLSVVAADVNGDNKLDLIVSSECPFYDENSGCGLQNGAVDVLFGNGDGSFQAATTYEPGGAFSIQVVVHDVNGDGNPDLVVANYCDDGSVCSGGQIGVLIGKGDGTFKPVVTYPSGGKATFSVAVADVDEDGKADLVVANGNCPYTSDCNPETVGVLAGNGDGTFQAAVSYKTGGNHGYGHWSDGVAVQDVNGDGRPDLLVVNECGTSPTCASGTIGVLINISTTTTALGSSPNPSNFGQVVTLTATVTPQGPGTPTGKVRFFDGIKNIGSSFLDGTGVATFLISTLSIGTHAMTAWYDGDSNFEPSNSSVLNQLVQGAIVVLSPTSLNFGNQAVGIASSPLGSTLKNTGNDTLMISSIKINGANSSDFAQNNNCGTSVPAGGSCTITVTFTPTDTGARSAAVSITDNASDSPESLPLSGVGTPPIVTLSPSSLTFAPQPVGTTSLPQTVTLSASGALSITSITTSAEYSQTNNCGSGIPVGGSCQINVTFTPTAPGVQKGTLMITDSGAGSPQSVPLSGTGTQPAVTLNPTSLNFGNQTVGIASSAQISTLKNTGNGTLTISSIGVTGANSSDFTENNNCGTSVPAGGSCKISVTFKPSGTGSESASVSITDNAPGSPQSLPLSGVGVLPAVTFSPTSLTFPTQVVFSTSPAQKVTLTNTGLGVLKITAGGISGQFAETTNCTPTIAPGASCTINVTFKPRNKGTLNGAISVTDNAPGSPQKVPLTGTGTYVQLSPTSLNFGTQPIHTTSLPKYITLTNKGSATVNFTGTGISVTGANAGDFAQTNNCGNSVASGASCHIRVTFTPSQQGQRTANVSISDDGGGSPQMVPLTGTGTP